MEKIGNNAENSISIAYPPNSPPPENHAMASMADQVESIPLEQQISITPVAADKAKLHSPSLTSDHNASFSTLQDMDYRPSTSTGSSFTDMDYRKPSSSHQDQVYRQGRTDEERVFSLMNEVNQNTQQQSVQRDMKPVNQKSYPFPIETIDDEDDEVIVVDEVLETEKDLGVKILFMNSDIGRKYRHEIEEFFKSLMRTETRMKHKERLPKIQPRPNFYSLDDGHEGESEIMESSTVIGSVEIYQHWMMDRMGWPMIANLIAQTPGIDLPQYEQHYLNAFPPKEDAVIVEEKPIRTSKTCFNCGGEGHEKKDCPKPFDRIMFRKNLQKFKASGMQYGRYHKGDSYKSMKPGVIGSALRNALGLRDDELPAHIYRMRELGYPPGWLQAAEVNNSGLAMFDRHGREVDLDGDLMEDGEVPEHRMRDENQLLYNADDLIAFPGFNIAAGDDFVDNGDQGHPHIKPDQSLNQMKKQLLTIQRQDRNKDMKRGFSTSSQDGGSGAKRQRLQHYDMDLSDEEQGSPSMPIEVINIEDDDQPPPPPSEQEPAPSDDDAPVDILETLSALEAEKQKILAELADTDEITSTPDGRGPSSRLGKTPEIIAIDMDDGEETDATNTSTVGQSLSYQICTPVISAADSYSNLPALDKFSEGISDHLPFENLPSSTGTYQKMSAVMQDVKTQMQKIRPKRKTK